MDLDFGQIASQCVCVCVCVLLAEREGAGAGNSRAECLDTPLVCVTEVEDLMGITCSVTGSV